MFACLIVLAGMGLAGMLPGMKYRAVLTDTWDQMTSMQLMLARHIMHGESIFYSWETSFGQNTSLLYAFCAYSPFTLLFILIPDAYTATVFGMVLKIAFSAMFFHLFLQYGLRRKEGWIIIFSLFYGLCGFQFEYMLSSNLMDALYLLPLVMLALMHSIREKKFIPLTLAYSMTFIIQFYSGFIIGLFSALYLLGYLFIRDGKEIIKKNIRIFAGYTLAVVTAVLISMILLMPAISFFISDTGFNSVTNVNKINPVDLFYAFLFGRPTSLKTDIPFLYCGIPVILLLPLYFVNKGITNREKAVMAIAMISLPISLYIDPVYLFLHAFNRPDGFTVRYAFIYVFIFVSLACRIYAQIADNEYKKRDTALYFLMQLALTVTVLLLHLYFGENTEGKGIEYAIYGNLILYPLWLCYVCFLGKKRRIGMIVAGLLTIMELGAQAYYNCREQGLVSADEVRAWDEQARQFIAEKKTDPADNVYRAHMGNSPYSNHSALYDYMGLGQFASSNYIKIQSLMARLGDNVSSMQYTQLGATDATDMLFGVRYRGYLTWTEDEKKGLGYEVYNRALPLGYMVSPYIFNMEYFDGNPFENQNRLISALCGEQVQAYTPADIWAHDENDAEFVINDLGYEIRKKGEDDHGEILIGIPETTYEHAYIYLQLLPYEEETKERKLPEDMAVNVAMYSTSDRKGSGVRFGSEMGNTIMEMTDDGNAFIVKIADFEGKEKCYHYTGQYMYYQDEKELDGAYEVLKQNTLRIEDFKAGYIKGKVNGSKEQPVLFLTIPYDRGWNVNVDGELVSPIAVVNDAFMAIYLQPGEHEIVMEFEAGGYLMGRVLFSAGIILFLVRLLIEFRKKA
ncbi:MAG: YfhO family protein [Lachnospiraceae bacterium]|nr:YfhO family protein [Lachnospiraceae bacterium]